MSVEASILSGLPKPLQTLCKTCKNDVWIGPIFRAFGGQDVKLDFGQRQMINTIIEYRKMEIERAENG